MRRQNEILGMLLFLGDVVIIVLIALFAPDVDSFIERETSTVTLFFYGAIWLVLNISFGIYWRFGEMYSLDFARKNLEITLLFFGITAVVFWRVYMASGSFNVRPKLVFLIFAAAGIGVVSIRILLLLLRSKLRSIASQNADFKTIVIGEKYLAEKVCSSFHRYMKGNECIGYFSRRNPKTTSDEASVMCLGDIECLKKNIQKYAHHRIICSMDIYEKDAELQDVLKDAENYLIKVVFVVNGLIYNHSGIQVGPFRYLPIFSYRMEPLSIRSNYFIKRSFDVVFSSLVILFVLSWLIPLLGLIIKLDSKGPIFFKQKRSGYNDEPFTCYKFRSMRVNGDCDKTQATKNDVRISRIGRFLRKSNLDEFPQFINVFLGDMSIVGPRPHMIAHTEFYSKEVDKYMVRHFALPGITGFAQVSGARGETKKIEDMQKRVEYDIWYLENWSFLLDIKIILLTITTALKGDKNAY